MPDIYCPGCGNEIKLSDQTYAFYIGLVMCRHCRASFHVVLGDMVSGIFGSSFTGAPRRGLAGGRLFGTPVLIEGPDPSTIPHALLRSIRHENIPDNVRDHTDAAIRHYEGGEYGSVAVPCRAAMQEALRQHGIADAGSATMIETARDRGVIRGFVSYCCEAIRTAGGTAAHSAASHTQGEALAVIGMVAVVLAALFEVPS